MQAIKKTDVSEEVGLLVLLKQRDNGTERSTYVNTEV
jgi:hypothetical protein